MTKYIESKIVGELTPNKYSEDYLESKPFQIPYFDNKELKVVFVEANHQPYLEKADSVLQTFLKLNSNDRVKDSEMVVNYYKETLEYYEDLKPLKLKEVKDIWKFVKPNEAVVNWDYTGDFYLCVSCECDWEEEHGLQLVFKDGKFLTRASGHDGHYTDEE